MPSPLDAIELRSGWKSGPRSKSLENDRTGSSIPEAAVMPAFLLPLSVFVLLIIGSSSSVISLLSVVADPSDAPRGWWRDLLSSYEALTDLTDAGRLTRRSSLPLSSTWRLARVETGCFVCLCSASVKRG